MLQQREPKFRQLEPNRRMAEVAPALAVRRLTIEVELARSCVPASVTAPCGPPFEGAKGRVEIPGTAPPVWSSLSPWLPSPERKNTTRGDPQPPRSSVIDGERFELADLRRHLVGRSKRPVAIRRTRSHHFPRRTARTVLWHWRTH